MISIEISPIFVSVGLESPKCVVSNTGSCLEEMTSNDCCYSSQKTFATGHLILFSKPCENWGQMNQLYAQGIIKSNISKKYTI